MVMVYRGVEVTFAEYGHKFSFVADLEGVAAVDREHPERRSFKSWEEATAEIDRIQALQTMRQRRQTRIEVLTDSGATATITGVHATRGTFNGLPDRYTTIYPKTDTVAKLIRERNAIQQELQAAQRNLHRFELDRIRRGHNNQSITPEYVDSALDDLSKDIEAKSALPEVERY
jgi:hypothetical protein